MYKESIDIMLKNIIEGGWKRERFDDEFIYENNKDRKWYGKVLVKNSYAPLKYQCECCEDWFVLKAQQFNKRSFEQIGLCTDCSIKYKGRSRLKDTNPELLEEWDYSLNSDLNVNYVSTHSHSFAHWICKNNPDHKWEASISNRAGKNTGCPYCNLLKNGAKDVLSSNLLKDRYPQLKEEWDFNKNKDIMDWEDATYGSHKKVWWICKENSEHKWEATIKNRAGLHSRCPYCSIGSHVSNIDLVIHYYLNKYIEGTIIKEYAIEKWTVDNYIENLNTCLEFDGGYYHNRRPEADMEKTEFILAKGYKLIKIVDSTNKVPKLDRENLMYINLKSYLDSDISDCIEELLKLLGKTVKINYKGDTASIKKLSKGILKEDSLGIKNPEVAKYYDSDKNNLSVFEVLPHSTKNYFWKCPDWGHEFISKASYMSNLKTLGKCPVCKYIDIWSKVYEFLPNEYIEDMEFKVTQEVKTFICPNCGDEFEATCNAMAQRCRGTTTICKNCGYK